jgi:hypothetical protein
MVFRHVAQERLSMAGAKIRLAFVCGGDSESCLN